MTDDTRIRIPSIPDVVYERLSTAISHGVYPAGPISIRKIAEGFGVSPMPVREALRRLEAEGLVTFNAGRQVVVNSLSLIELEEIFAIRMELEALAVSRATSVLAHNPSALAVIRLLVEAMDAKVDDPNAWLTENWRFHKALYEPSALPRLQGIVQSLWISVEPYLRIYSSLSHDNLRAAQREHWEILHFVEEGDSESASDALRKHLNQTYELLRRRLGGEEQSSAAAADAEGSPGRH